MENPTREELQALKKFTDLVNARVEIELSTTYVVDSKINEILFKKECQDLPENDEGFNTASSFISIEVLYRLIGMIKRGELILNPKANGKG